MKTVTLLTVWLTKGLFFVGACAVMAMMLHVGIDVAARAILGRPTLGMVETVTNYYIIAACFLPIGFVQMRSGHLTVEAFTYALPARAIRWITVGAMLVAAMITTLLTWHSTLSALERTRRGSYIDITAFDLPIWPARWLLVIGYGAVLVTLCLQIVLALTGRPLPFEGEADE